MKPPTLSCLDLNVGYFISLSFAGVEDGLSSKVFVISFKKLD